MRIYLGIARFIANAELIRESFHTAVVCLSGGRYIKRHKRRDFVDYEGDKVREVNYGTATTEPIFTAKRATFWNRLVSLLRRIWATLVCPIGSDNRGPKGE